MEFIGEYTVEIIDTEGYTRYITQKNFTTKYCKEIYDWENPMIGIPSSPPFPNPMILEDDFESKNAAVSGNLEAASTTYLLEDKETSDGRQRRFKTTTEITGPINVLGFILYSSEVYSAVNMPFSLDENEKMFVYYTVLMRW